MMNVADVLDLTVSEASLLFAYDREVIRALQPIVDVGLEYVKLGQPVPTLSGGEAQRLKLAGFLAGHSSKGGKGGKAKPALASISRQALALRAHRGTLFLLDEPTTGLHFDDIAKLMRALRRLLEAGHSLIVIEHNLDVIRASDWLIDLGPEGGDAGEAPAGILFHVELRVPLAEQVAQTLQQGGKVDLLAGLAHGRSEAILLVAYTKP
jgi:excinuclease ABC subunit A